MSHNVKCKNSTKISLVLQPGLLDHHGNTGASKV